MFAASTRTYAYVPYICTYRYIPGHVCMNVLSCGVMWRVCKYIIYMCVCVCATGAVNGPAGFAGFCSRLALQLEVALVG